MQVTHIDSSFRLDPSSTLNMQNMYDTVAANFPKGNQKVIGIEFPLIGLYCNTSGLINPDIDIKEVISRLFSFGGIDILRVVFDKLLALLQALGGAFLDEKLPVLELSIRDIFRQDFRTTLNTIVTRLYDGARDTLIKLLNSLGITFPLLDAVLNKANEIAMLVKSIMDSLVKEVIKKIKLIIDLIKTALEIYTAANQGTIGLLITWQNAIAAFLNSVLNYFLNPPTLNELVGLVKKLAAEVYGVAKATYAQLVAILEKFKLPLFGSPLDWRLPLSNVKIPNIDFYKIMTDMVTWLNNYVINLIKKFIDAVLSVLQFFGIGVDWLAVNLPIRLCVVNVTDIKPKAA